MRLWVEDFKYQLAMALRVVGVGLAAVAWISVLGSEFQQGADARTIAQVGAAIVAVCVAQLFTGQPPSATIVDLLRPFERDILAVAKERAHGDPDQADFFAARIAALAAVRIRRGADLPRDRRAWLRALARLAGDD
jgi:hypothetical protein